MNVVMSRWLIRGLVALYVGSLLVSLAAANWEYLRGAAGGAAFGVLLMTEFTDFGRRR